MPFTFADDLPPGEAPDLGTEQLEALETGKTAWAYIHGYGFPPIPLRLMPARVDFVADKLSLVPDPSDSEDGLIPVYLVNATDEKVAGADYFNAHCFLEVKDGNRWRACERFIPGCGTGMIGMDLPEPKPLSGRHAEIFFDTDPNQGDLKGEMRFCLTGKNSRPIVSATFQGRFDSKRFEGAAPRPTPASSLIVEGLADMMAGKASDESRQRIARSPEEYVAAAELERCYDESSSTKNALIRWQASIPAGEEMATCRTALAALLKQPWDRNKDAPGLFDRCFTALTRKDGGTMDYGSPERCRAAVWRYLSEFHSERQEVFINPERWDQLEAIRKSGNPWGVDQKLVTTLVEEAIASLRSPDPAEREAAGTFLGGYWITATHLSDERCWSLLEQDVASARKAGVTALIRREMGQQCGKWLAEHLDLPGSDLASLWKAATENRNEFADWELPVALRLLETSPLETAGTLARRSDLIKEAGGPPLPIELQASLRRFLVEEAKAKRFIGLSRPKPGESEYTESRHRDPRSREPHLLRQALYALAAWQDPADTSLFKSYLDHPAAYYSSSDEKPARFYTVRSAAAEVLKERNEAVPEGVIFEEPLN